MRTKTFTHLATRPELSFGMRSETINGKRFRVLSEEELRQFMEYFKDELPDPEHYPIKVMWLYRWWKSIVIRNRDADVHIQK